MTGPRHFHPAEWVADIHEIQNAQGNALFKNATLSWLEPTIIERDVILPDHHQGGEYLYAIVRNHHRSLRRDTIEYIGLTTNPATRFYNHAKLEEIRSIRGTVSISFAPIDFIHGRNRIRNIGRALEEIEHILIWALSPAYNDRKFFSLPGMGKNRANAWHVINDGYRFAGRMPREIVFPWMLIKPGRDRSLRAT